MSIADEIKFWLVDDIDTVAAKTWDEAIEWHTNVVCGDVENYYESPVEREPSYEHMIDVYDQSKGKQTLRESALQHEMDGGKFPVLISTTEW